MDKRTIATFLGHEAEKRFELECIVNHIPCYKEIGQGQTDYVIEIESKLYRIQ
jgi:hypothetical protein